MLTEDNSYRSDQSASVNSELQETVEMSACEPSTSFEDDTCKTPDLERQIAKQSTKIGELEEKLKQAESEINLHHENIELNEKLAECKCQQKEMSLRLFCVDRFTTETFHRGRHFFLHWSVQLCDFYGHFRVFKVFSWTSQAQERSLPAKRSKLQEEQEILEAEITATACEVPRFFADFKSTTLLWLHAQRPHHTLHKHHEYNFR